MMDRTEIQSIMDKYPDTDLVQTFGKSLLEVMGKLETATMGQEEGFSPASSEQLAELGQELDNHVKGGAHPGLPEGPTEVHPCRCAPCATDKKTALAESWNMGQKALLKTFDQAAAAENVEGARDVLVEAVRKHRNGNPDKSGIPDDALATIMAQ